MWSATGGQVTTAEWTAAHAATATQNQLQQQLLLLQQQLLLLQQQSNSSSKKQLLQRSYQLSAAPIEDVTANHYAVDLFASVCRKLTAGAAP
jgi:hypothetical protein